MVTTVNLDTLADELRAAKRVVERKPNSLLIVGADRRTTYEFCGDDALLYVNGAPVSWLVIDIIRGHITDPASDQRAGRGGAA